MLLLQPQYGLARSGQCYMDAIMTLVRACRVQEALMLLDQGDITIETRLCENRGRQRPWTTMGGKILRAATDVGCLDLVKVMLERGVDVDDEKFDGWRALEYAAKGGHVRIPEYLLKNGASFNENTCLSESLTLAVVHGHLAIVSTLLKAGADINTLWSKDTNTPLYHAAKHGHTYIVRYLLQQGAKLEIDYDIITIDCGYNAVEEAAEKGYEEILRLLLTYGVKVHPLPDEDSHLKSWTPLAAAKQKGHKRIFRILMDSGVTE